MIISLSMVRSGRMDKMHVHFNRDPNAILMLGSSRLVNLFSLCKQQLIFGHLNKNIPKVTPKVEKSVNVGQV